MHTAYPAPAFVVACSCSRVLLPHTDTASSKQSKELAVRTLLAGAAQYICLAHALQPSKDIYRKSLAVVRQMLPLPFLRAGYLTAPRARSIGTVTETYRRDWFVLDQRSLRQASNMEMSLSTAGAGGQGAEGSGAWLCEQLCAWGERGGAQILQSACMALASCTCLGTACQCWGMASYSTRRFVTGFHVVG